MDTDASPDYEPSADELKEWLESWKDVGLGAHGQMTILPTMEQYIWHLEGVFFGNRSVDENGLVSFVWLTPQPSSHA